MLLVAVHLLSEFGAFAMLRFQTFTTAIYDEYKLSFDGAAASMLASVLVLLCLVLLVAELGAARQRRATRGSTPARRGRRRRPELGRAPSGPVSCRASPALDRARPRPAAGHARLLGAATGSSAAELRPRRAAVRRRHLAGARASAPRVLTTLLALPVSILTMRHPSRTATVLERAAYLPFALPGIVVALSLIVALGPLLPGALRDDPAADRRLRDPLAAAGAGRHPRGAGAGAAGPRGDRALARLPARWQALVRVTLPRILPGLGAAAALVFLATVTELTATLLLAPIGTQTLATQFWAEASTRSPTARPPPTLL